MAFIKPELIDYGPTGDTVQEGVRKNDLNIDDIYENLNKIVEEIPELPSPTNFYRLDGTQPLTADFAANGFILKDVANPVELTDAVNVAYADLNYLKLSGGVVTGLISCASGPTDGDHLVNKTYADNISGGGDAIWGGITGDIDNQADLKVKLDAKSDSGHGHPDATSSAAGFLSTTLFDRLDAMNDPALLEEFRAFSAGTADAGMPIKLDGYGVLDVSFLSIKVFNLQGDWTPTPAEEYPSPAEGGDYWVIEGVGDLASGGYTFTTGYLDGRVVFDNELLVKGRDDKWGIIHLKVDPRLYYKLDGTNHLTADFQAGGFKLRNVANPVADGDAATKGWSDGKFLPLAGGTVTGLISCSPTPTADAHLVNKAYVDSQGGWTPEDNSTLRLNYNTAAAVDTPLDIHSTPGGFYNFRIIRKAGNNGDIQLINRGNGNFVLDSEGGQLYFHGSRVWTDAYHPGEGGEVAWGSITGTVSNQTDMWNSFGKLNYDNGFRQRCIRDNPDSTNGYVMWEAGYAGKAVFAGLAPHSGIGASWYNFIASFQGSVGAADPEVLYATGDFSADFDGVHSLGESGRNWKTLFVTTPPYQTADQAKIRNIATLSNIDADFLLSLTPKLYEVTPTGITGSPFLADQPAPLTAKTRLGFVAQDVDAALIAAGYNPDDFALTTGEAGHRCVSTGELIPLLVKKIQDLETRISALENP